MAEMKDLQISKESYDYLRNIEKQNRKRLDKALLLQIAELHGKYVIYHVTKVRKEDEIYIMTAETKGEFNTHAEAKMSMRGLKVLLSEELKREVK